MDNYKAYAQLAILNGNGKPQTNSVNLVIDNQNVTCELLQVKNNTQTGYQGYLYQNLETGELYIVHSGSQSLDPGDAPLSDQNRSEVMNDYINNVVHSWVTGEIPPQFEDAYNFLSE